MQQVPINRLLIFTALILLTSLLIVVGCAKEPAQTVTETNDVLPTENDFQEVEPTIIEPVELEINEAEQHYNAGLDFREKEQYEAAITEFDEAIELDPLYIEAYYKRGNTYCKMGQLETGIQDLSMAIELDSQHSDAYYDRGAAYCTLGQMGSGIEDLDQAIRLDPTDAMAHGSRGNAYYELGELVKALRDCDEAIKLDPEYGYPYYVLGNIYHQQGQLEKSLENYNEAIRLDPQLVWAYNNRASIHHELNQFEEAVRDLDMAIDLDPEEPSAYYNRGNAYCRLAQYENGIIDYGQAITLDPLFTQAYYNRGLALGNVGRKEEAIADFEMFLTLSDDEFKIEEAKLEIEKLTRIFLDIPSLVSPEFVHLANLCLSNDDLPKEVWLVSFQELSVSQVNDAITLIDELEGVSSDFTDEYISSLSWLLENGYTRSLQINSNSQIFQQEIKEFSSPEEAEAAMLEIPQITLDLLTVTWEELGFEVTTEFIEIEENGLSPDSWGIFFSMQVVNDSMSMYYIAAREGNLISGITLMGSTIIASPYSTDTVDDALMISRMALAKIREMINESFD